MPDPRKRGAYERLLEEEIFTGIAARHIPGYRGIRLLRRQAGDEVELVTIMTFDDWEGPGWPTLRRRLIPSRSVAPRLTSK